MASPFAPSSSLFHIEPLDCGETCRRAMDTCYLCGNPLTRIRDIFMYRGDTPFCSEECRIHEMEMDEARAKMTTKLLMERASRNEQRYATSGSESGSITCAANVPVAS